MLEDKMLSDIYTSEGNGNWLYSKYYAAGSNSRYFTFQLALNLLRQQRKEDDLPYMIIETGCQRQQDDLGAGMSTSIFAEWASKYNGMVISVDNEDHHLRICEECVAEWSEYTRLILSDSIDFLSTCTFSPDLLYLDSLDYPIAENEGNIDMINAAQEHCLNEFKAIENKLKPSCILLADDNQLPAGGKPRLLKEYLFLQGWICLLDFQQTCWIRKR
jgi:hypothetical protein